MPGERNSPPIPQYRRRWADYLANLETISVLEKALEMARTSAEKQRAEVLELLGSEKWELINLPLEIQLSAAEKCRQLLPRVDLVPPRGKTPPEKS